VGLSGRPRISANETTNETAAGAGGLTPPDQVVVSHCPLGACPGSQEVRRGCRCRNLFAPVSPEPPEAPGWFSHAIFVILIKTLAAVKNLVVAPTNSNGRSRTVVVELPACAGLGHSLALIRVGIKAACAFGGRVRDG
jgi:hypothetical protein